MFLRSAVGGWVMAGMLVVAAGAQELLPAGVINVALPDFGALMSEPGDYGLGNLVPVEVVKDPGRQQEIRLFRTPKELEMPRLGEARFRVRLGNTDTIHFWIESPPVQGSWNLTVVTIHHDGYGKTIFGENILINAHYPFIVQPNSVLEFRITSLEQHLLLSRRFVFTVSPDRIYLPKDFRFYPYGRGVLETQ